MKSVFAGSSRSTAPFARGDGCVVAFIAELGLMLNSDINHMTGGDTSACAVLFLFLHSVSLSPFNNQGLSPLFISYTMNPPISFSHSL